MRSLNYLELVPQTFPIVENKIQIKIVDQLIFGLSIRVHFLTSILIEKWDFLQL